MEQTDATVVPDSTGLEIDSTMDLRRSRINLLSATVDEANFYINEVSVRSDLHQYRFRARHRFEVSSCECQRNHSSNAISSNALRRFDSP